MDINVETITPQVAREMLSHNDGNRPFDKSICARYASELKEGKWLEDGATIRFAANGRLLDGQHRLTAICMSGVALEAIVIRGLDENAFKTIDTGKTRGGSDVLGINGYKNTHVAAAITASWFYYVNSGHPADKGGAQKVTNSRILDVYQQNPEIEDAAYVLTGNKWLKYHLTAKAFGVLYVAACKRGEVNKVREFFYELSSPTEKAIGTSVILLREKLIENKASRDKISNAAMTAYVFKAYRDYRAGRAAKILKLYLKDGKITKEQFKL